MTRIFSRLFGQSRNSCNTKKTLYLHIGMGKTGTTALQVFFSGNRKAMEKQGIAYPSLGKSKVLITYCRPMCHAFWREPGTFNQ